MIAATLVLLTHSFNVRIASDFSRIPSAADVRNSVEHLSNMSAPEWLVEIVTTVPIVAKRGTRDYVVRITTYRETMPSQQAIADQIVTDSEESGLGGEFVVGVAQR